MKIGLTFDLRDYYAALGFSEEDAAEFDFEATIESIEKTLRELDFETERIGTIAELVSALAGGRRWDFIFNIAEGVYGIGREAQVPAICDAYRIPYTFSDPCIMSLSLNKELTKRVVRDLGLPTPDFFLLHSMEELDHVKLKYPMFAKPYSEGTGKGITAASVIRDREGLVSVCDELLKRYNQPVLIESYLPGREFTVGIIGTGNSARVAGVMEVILHENAESGVYSYVNKEKCEELVTYKLADDDTAVKAGELALSAWRGLGCFDAGRIDVRCDSFGNPGFIEVNPLAGLHPEHSDLPIICTKAGISFIELIGRIMGSALGRYNMTGLAPKKVLQYGKVLPVKKAAGRAKPGKGVSGKRIVILHQKVYRDSSEDEQDVLIQRDEISASVEKMGFQAIPLEMTLDIESTKKTLAELNPWKVFNLVESLGGNDRLMGIAPSLMDSMGIRYTGSRTEAMVISGNKMTAKRLMRRAGIPTPDFYYMAKSKRVRLPQGRYIVKSSCTHASAGIKDNSIIDIVTGNEEIYSILKERGLYDADNFIEAYIEGREFNISLLESPHGTEVLPHAEILFTGYPEGKPRIVDYKAKWDSDSFEYQNTMRNYNFEENDKPLLKSLEHHAMQCWDVFGLGGYARVDFRVDGDGHPWVLEVNANPCLTSEAGFMAAAGKKGLAFDEVIQRILGI